MNNSVELPSNVWPVCKQTWVSRVSESFNHPPQVAYLRSSAASPELWHNDWIFKNVGIRIVFVLALVGDDVPNVVEVRW